jgi:hypothetical protein
MRAGSLFKLRCVGLDPSEDRRVVDLDSAVEEHAFQIAVADREHQIPSHGPKDRLSCELPPLETITQTHTDARPIVPPQSYGKSASSKVCNRTAMLDHLQIMKLAVSLGGTETALSCLDVYGPRPIATGLAKAGPKVTTADVYPAS